MADNLDAPQYAPNSDVEDPQDPSSESDDERSPHPDVKPVVDPWNDDESDSDSPARKASSSPDYLGAANPEAKRATSTAAWDALGEEGDTTDDDLPPGISVGGRETKGSVKREVSAGGEDGRNGHHAADEPARKRQRTTEPNAAEPGATSIFKSAPAPSPRPVTHDAPSAQPPTYTAPPPPPTARNPMDRYPPHVPMPGLVMKSFFGITPRDEFVRIIGEWLLQVCRGQRGIEVGSLWFVVGSGADGL